MEVNVKKCKAISYSRTQNAIEYCYALGGPALARVNKVTWCFLVTFHKYPRYGCLHQSKHECWVLPWVIPSPEALKIIFCSVMRKLLELSSLVLSPYPTCLISEIQKIQDRFGRLVGVRLAILYREVQITELTSFMDLDCLARQGAVSGTLCGCTMFWPRKSTAQSCSGPSPSVLLEAHVPKISSNDGSTLPVTLATPRWLECSAWESLFAERWISSSTTKFL